MGIKFGSPEARAILEADKELRQKEKQQRQGKKWYIVRVEETILVEYKVLAHDEQEAMENYADGEQFDILDCVDADALSAWAV